MNEKKISESIKNPIHEENKNLLDALFDQSNVMIAHMDTQFNFIRVSKAYAEADKKGTAFFMGKNHFYLYPNEENEQIFRNVVETGEPYYVTAKDFKYAEHLDWGVTSWDWSLIPIENPNGDVKSLVLTIFNITAQKKIEEEFLKERKFTDTALNAQRDTFFVFDPAKGKAVRWNKAFEEISGYSDEELSNLMAPESYYREEELKQLEIATQVIEQGRTTINELNLITKEGNLIPFEYVASGIFDDEANLKYIVAIGRDITERKKVERKLRESEEKYRTLFEQAPDMIFIIDPDTGQIIESNNRVFDIYGYTREEIKTKKITDFEAMESADEVRRHVSKMVDEGDDIFETQHRTKTGDLRDILISTRIINIKSKDFIQAFCRDITQKKIAEKKLKESEEKFRTLSDYSMVGISIIQDMEIKYINQRMADYLGYTREELLNLEPEGFLNIIHPDDRDRGKKISLNNQLGGKKTTDHFELRIIKKNGNTIYIEVYARTILYDGRSAAMNVSIDITDRIITEQKLKESEEKFRTITEDSHLAISIIQDNILKYANQKMADLMGYSIEEMLNWKPGEFMKVVTPDYIEIVREQVKKKQLGDPEVIVQYSIQAVKKSGELFWVDNISKTIMYEGRPADLVTQIDITERKKVQEELFKLNQLKSELLIRTSHELKTPAMHIKGYADLLLYKYKNNLGSEELQVISNIKKGCLRLESLIYDILHKSELDSGYSELNKVKSDLSSLIELSVRELRSFAALRAHSINLDIHNSMIIDIDKDQMRHVINNLITNAIKYTPLNGIIGINSTITDDFITISVQDNGIGFTKEQIDRLFTQFGKIERYGQGYDIITDGSGLGLYIAKSIIELHDGKIWVESEGPNKGSTFNFSLPLK